MPLSLPSLFIDPNRISVSGISAGAFMAHQLHIAYSDMFCGAGLIAGGAYQVSQNSLIGALAFGMRGHKGWSPSMLAAFARKLADEGNIAPVSNLKKSRVWVFHGTLDTTVSLQSSNALVNFYQEFIGESALRHVTDVDVVHAMPTDMFGSLPHARSQSPYICNAHYDAAGELLKHIHGPLLLRAEGELTGELISFDQNAFIADATSHSMDTLGLAYIPSGARAGRKCGIHVALHGCGQSNSAIGDVFVQNAGYNEWAEANDFIVLYPQARPLVNLRVFNPRGSFDWWGLDDSDYSLRSGRQMKAIANMVQALAGRPPVELRMAA